MRAWVHLSTGSDHRRTQVTIASFGPTRCRSNELQPIQIAAFDTAGTAGTGPDGERDPSPPLAAPPTTKEEAEVATGNEARAQRKGSEARRSCANPRGGTGPEPSVSESGYRRVPTKWEAGRDRRS
jgi:hypothetical protein